MSSLKTRILTGVIGIPIVLLCIFGPVPLIYLLAFVLMAALNYELAQMQGEQLQRSFLLFGFLNMLIAFGCYLFVTKELGLFLPLPTCWSWRKRCFLIREYSFLRCSILLLSTFMRLGCRCALISLRLLSDGAWLLMSVFIMVWICDSGAYFSGYFLGKHKMAPRLSPKKTIEGGLGGIILTVVAAIIIEQFLPLATSMLHTCIIGLLVAAGAIIGGFV